MANFRQAKGQVTLFFITMNMHARSGTPTHMVVGAVDGVNSVEQFCDMIDGRDFILVEEFYRGKNPDPGGETVKDAGGSDYHSVGVILLNVMYIGKVKL